MEKDVLNVDTVKKYMIYIILSILIVILMGVSSYDNLNSVSGNTKLIVEENSLELKEIKNISGAKYINTSDYNTVNDNNIYLDKIARKLIYTSKTFGVKKEKIDNNNNIIYEDSTAWVSLKGLASAFGTVVYDIPEANSITFVQEDGAMLGTVLKSNTEIYYCKYKNSIYNIHLDADTKINVIDELQNEPWVLVTYSADKRIYLGYILKNNITYEKQSKTEIEIEEKLVSLLISENGKYEYIDGINTVAVDGITITSITGNITEENRAKVLDTLKAQDVKIVRIIDNGYTAVNADNSLMSLLFQSEANREKSIKKIVAYGIKNKLYGIVIDFKELKVLDKEIYTQYIRELKSELSKAKLKLYVKSNMKSYIDTENILNIADGVILELYGERGLASVTSGTHSDISNIKKSIAKLSNKKLANKIILEIPLYNILWTERNGIIMDREIYSAKLAKQYISKNKIKISTNKTLNQNYFEVQKGSITYKMWLEDEYALANKLKLVKENNLLGYSIYKSGYETQDIMEVIKNEI